MWWLEVNDTQIRLWQDGDLLYAEPGVAHVERKSVMLGDKALNQSFVHPVQSASMYWQKLNEEATENRTKTVGKQSDLLFNQLNEIFAHPEFSLESTGWVIFAGDVDATQAGLLYGILAHKNIALRGIVNGVASAVSLETLPEHAYFIDMHLHRTVVTEIQVADDTVKQVETKSLMQMGYMQLMNRCINTVAERSLDETRFDPRVSGATEQQVFDQLHQRLHSSDAVLNFNIDHNDEVRNISVPWDDLIAGCSSFYHQLLAACGENDQLIFNERLTALPGFEAYVQQSGYSFFSVDDTHLAKAIAGIADSVADGADVEYLKEYTVLAPTAEYQNATITSEMESLYVEPTHLLQGHNATPLNVGDNWQMDGKPIAIFHSLNGKLALEPHDGTDLRVNDTVIEQPTFVSSGDRLTAQFGSDKTAHATLITVLGSG